MELTEKLFKRIFRGKSKFYREFMINLIKDILWILLGLICLIGFVRGFILIK